MYQRRNILWLGVAVLATAGVAWGQSRTGLSYTGVRIQGVGQGNQNMIDFTRDSYGLGTLRQSSPAPGSSLLRSSIYGPASLTFSRAQGGLGGNAGVPGLPAPARAGGTLYKPLLRSSDGMDMPRLGAGMGVGPRDMGTALAGTFLAPQDIRPNAQLTAEGPPITSFVPTEPSPYQAFMAEGERLFRAGDFGPAFAQFRLANYYASDDAASLLSMCHAMVAQSNFSSAGFYLRSALRFLPELPLVRLQPKALFGEEEAYRKVMDGLREYVADNGYDPDGYLLLAYFAWFGDNASGAVTALEQAETSIKNVKDKAAVTETIDIFRRGMTASGRLQTDAATQPAAAKDEDKPAAVRDSQDR